MPGEGFIAHMVASLKNNKRERISTFEKMKNFKEGKNIQVHFDKKATPHQLKTIREKLKKENRKKTKQKALILAVFVVLLIYFIGFVKI